MVVISRGFKNLMISYFYRLRSGRRALVPDPADGGRSYEAIFRNERDAERFSNLLY